MSKRTFVVLMMACVVASAVLFGSAMAPAAQLDAVAAEQGRVAAGESQELADFAGKLETLFQQAAEKVQPAVVAITATTVSRGRRYRSPLEDDPFFQQFRQFFGPGFPGSEQAPDQQPQERRRSGLGSGMILDKEGHILTNNHVVQGADELSVELADGRRFDAEVVGTDDKIDLAVIRVKGEAKDLPTVELGDSDTLKAGQWVLAVGNPYGFTHTVSAGIVSATGRSGLGVADYESLIQTDAAINPGNSGGPLVNLRGEVVGINAAIYSGTGGYAGIGFAIPVNMAIEVLDDLVEGREVRRGRLGIYIKDLTPEMAEMFDFEGTEGVLVDEVITDSPAEEGKFEAGDIVVEYDGRKVTNRTQLRLMAAATDPGTAVRVKVWRDGGYKNLRVTVGELEATAAAGDPLGLTVEPLTRERAERLGRPDLSGVVVTQVSPDSPVARALTPGDVIRSVNRRRLTSVEDYRKAVSELESGDRVLLHVLDSETGRLGYVGPFQVP